MAPTIKLALSEARRLCRPLDGCVLAMFGEELATIRTKGVQEISDHVTGTYPINSDPVVDRFQSEGPSELRKRSLGGSIGADTRECLKTGI